MTTIEELNARCPVIASGVLDKHDSPHALIQWSTDLCADIYCACGWQMHADGDFLYAVKCGNCGLSWELEPIVRLIPQQAPCPWHEPTVLQAEES